MTSLEEVVFDVEVALLPAGESKRTLPIATGYRPNHKHPLTGDYIMGQFTFANDEALAPRSTARATVRVLAPPALLPSLRGFGSWTIWEGARHIGTVRLID